jgi:hypothetical protein
MWRRAVWYIGTKVSEKPATFGVEELLLNNGIGVANETHHVTKTFTFIGCILLCTIYSTTRCVNTTLDQGRKLILEKYIYVRSRKPRLTTGGIRCADHATPSIRKSWHYFANKRRLLGRHSSLADQSHGVVVVEVRMDLLLDTTCFDLVGHLQVLIQAHKRPWDKIAKYSTALLTLRLKNIFNIKF